MVEYVVHSQMCESCHRREAKDTWKAVVQVRQKVTHKKTFFYLEQLIIKHQAQQYAVNIKSQPDGLDFFFSTKVCFPNGDLDVNDDEEGRMFLTDVYLPLLFLLLLLPLLLLLLLPP